MSIYRARFSFLPGAAPQRLPPVPVNIYKVRNEVKSVVPMTEIKKRRLSCDIFILHAQNNVLYGCVASFATRPTAPNFSSRLRYKFERQVFFSWKQFSNKRREERNECKFQGQEKDELFSISIGFKRVSTHPQEPFFVAISARQNSLPLLLAVLFYALSHLCILHLGTASEGLDVRR